MIVSRSRALCLTVLVAVWISSSTGGAFSQAGGEPGEEQTRLLRHPDIHGETIAFSYAGDLWTVAAEGGEARRLTSHRGLELFPRFSPDGRWIAFTGEYGGTSQVHVIPAGGGEPRQLTYYNSIGGLPPRGGVDNRVVGWTPDGEEIVFLAHRLPYGERREVPYTVPLEGGMEKPLGVPRGSGGMLADDGKRFVYTPGSREFRTWKRYFGGNAQDVWIFDLADGSAKQLTEYEGTDNQPMWVDGTVYFTSDRSGGTLNLFAIDPAAASPDAGARQVTHHEDWDALWPAAGPDAIVYEAGGWIWRFDPASGESTKVPIRVYGDFEGTVPYWTSVVEQIQNAGISPSGARALVDARGDLFTIPAEEGEVRNLTRSPGVRERDPAWSPDGARIAYWSDRTGEYALYVRSSDGIGEERRLTSFGDADPVWRYAPRWSPDAKKIAFGDRAARLWVIDVDSGALREIDRGDHGDITDARWSPDSRWLAYTKVGENNLASIWVHSLESGSNHRLTDTDTHEAEPTWDPEGRYLYFLSNRDYNLTFSSFEFDYVYTDPTRLYVGLLHDEAPPLLLPESDEETTAKETDEEKEATDGEGEGRSKTKSGAKNGEEKSDLAKKPVRVAVETEEFESRVRAIPGAPGAYGSLAATAKGVLYLQGEGGGRELRLFDLDAEEAKTIVAGLGAYELAAGGEKILAVKTTGEGPTLAILPIEPDQALADHGLDLSGLETRVEPEAEWKQEFVDAWRILRDWFYDPGMHGLDWQALREQYEPLVAHVAHRADLDYILGELGGELEAGHVYVQTSGDWQIERREGGLLGAEIVADPSGHFRVEKIFPGENWHEDFRSPLTMPGVDVETGDLILAVDGVPTDTVDNFYRLLENKGDRVVTLTVADDASGRNRRQARVRPITQETNLRYLDWVESRRRYTQERSGGRIGYIHLPNTAVEGTRELFRGFYAQAHEDALVLDVRYNGGGFIPFGLIDLLDRPLLSYWARRNVAPFTTPGFYHRGPKVTLTNGYSGSGGDAFPYYFRQQGLGPVIGTRTWGGLIGISGNPALADGGAVLAPTFRFVDPEGMWAVEGVGVEPDIVVVDRPDLEAKGIDPSLDAAIELLLQELEENPPQPLVVPEPPEARGRSGSY